jgi:hypothetical protein
MNVTAVQFLEFSRIVEIMYYLDKDDYDDVVKQMLSVDGEKFLIMVRGLPGTGKSTLGKRLCTEFDGIQIENDQQFTINGEYVYSAAKLDAAHHATLLETRNLMSEGAPCVVVSNTFTRFWEMDGYHELAKRFNYTTLEFDLYLYIRRKLSRSGATFSVPAFLEFLSKSNVHSVPEDKLKSMLDR